MYDYQAIRRYGHIGGEVFTDWGNKLKNFKNEELRKGLKGCLECSSEHAPGLKTFIGYCKNMQQGLTHNSAAYREFRKEKLLTNKTKKEDAVKHIQSLRELLK